jgi:hypothetical protein
MFSMHLLNSCITVYIPNTINTPLFSDKGEFAGSIAGGSSGIDIQAAYAVTDKFAVMVNYSNSQQSDDYSSTSPSQDDSYIHNHNMLEAALGYYSVPNKWLNFEIFGGYGYSSVYSKNDDYYYTNNDTVEGGFGRFFLQPSMGIISNYVDLAFTPRIVMVNFDGKINNSVNKTGSGVFIEPNLTLKLGFKQFKFFTQFGFSYKINSSGYNFDYQPFMFSIGAQVTLGRKREKSLFN